MKIKRFLARNVYGYLNFDIRFNDDLTLLTGINGSGKTTILRCLYSILTPSFLLLSRISYDFMEVTIKLPDQRKYTKIRATKNKDSVLLSTSNTSQDLIVPMFYDVPSERPASERLQSITEREQQYSRDIETRNLDNEVFKLIRDLPTPMLLGLERRTIERRDSIYPPPYYSSIRRTRASILRGFQFASLYEAEYLARDRYLVVQSEQRQLMNSLRTSILLTSLEYEDIMQLELAQFFETPSRDIYETKDMVSSIASELGLPAPEVSKQLNLFSSKLETLSNRLGEAITDEEKLQKIVKGDDEDKRNAMFEWIVNIPQFRRINKIFTFVKNYIQEGQKIDISIRQYLTTINKFLKDSDKEIAFDNQGYLTVNIKNHESVPITSLSSGESQIVVMITHLAFNPDAQLNNVFMVDEPELSLHVAWQELFVKSIKEVNPNLQLILATHAPSIILDRIDKCIDLGK